MESARWADILAQAIFHTLVAALFVEALVRSWRVNDPGQRIALRLTALGYPLVVFPALVTLFPLRAEERFRDGLALFSGRRWEDVTVLGHGLFEVFVLGLAGLGAVLLLMDLVPMAWRRRTPRPRPVAPDPRSAAALEAALSDLGARTRLRRPEVQFVDGETPAIFCTGVRTPAIVVSRGALRLLDADELRAALAHELSHLVRRDPAASWGVFAARVLLFFNPAFQVVSRTIARDAEWLADERAAELSGDRLALASGLLKLHRATLGRRPAARRTLPLAGALSEPLARVRSRDVEVRCRRLLDGPAPRLPFGAARVALAGIAVTALLFFVV
ncbi:M56 family metallopeptidase [Anaeromyxobacter oryzisoli]|uniref:M56 family metallopeptidase n=1 Tax=Anaeromyxobacter oryzisoli TaxID=2925408 RepID=UPI001F5A4566|nr:M56 family metallopeptidase [Anaeromyxobacter sp. SG63]